MVTAATYTVGGTVAGLSGTVVLQNNGGDNLLLSADGPFTFPIALADGSTYSVTVLANPVNQTCAIGNPNGTIAGANATNLLVNCSTIVCGGFNSGFCIVDEATGLLTGMCEDVGNCISGPSCDCQGVAQPLTVGAFCGPIVDNTPCFF